MHGNISDFSKSEMLLVGHYIYFVALFVEFIHIRVFIWIYLYVFGISFLLWSLIVYYACAVILREK